ncbi:uncharacterized protein LOC115350812 isoform X2 [Aquila chrysaetos chrysaetos]|uniref:uncharacterized protein LOC115350812 isoform X2 n=1 Tax=Aquila chrysaetos chrysaetos TaxID=223781 RepID=UPI001176D9F2|nr:uncharacterized protein LOC115350812 isoform X2 [Aquila chrysaetos chrysaetos]
MGLCVPCFDMRAREKWEDILCEETLEAVTTQSLMVSVLLEYRRSGSPFSPPLCWPSQARMCLLVEHCPGTLSQHVPAAGADLHGHHGRNVVQPRPVLRWRREEDEATGEGVRVSRQLQLPAQAPGDTVFRQPWGPVAELENRCAWPGGGLRHKRMGFLESRVKRLLRVSTAELAPSARFLSLSRRASRDFGRVTAGRRGDGGPVMGVGQELEAAGPDAERSRRRTPRSHFSSGVQKSPGFRPRNELRELPPRGSDCSGAGGCAFLSPVPVHTPQPLLLPKIGVLPSRKAL